MITFEEATAARRSLLANLYDRYANDPHPALDGLRRGAQGRFVPGVGDPMSPVVLVGEAPGATEQRAGAPFAGASGRVLDDLLASVRLKREDCYLTNVVRYRPVDSRTSNRRPTEAEVAVSKPYLNQELEVLRPEVVVTLGKAPMNALMGDHFLISACHGLVHRNPSRRYSVVTLYHPSVGVYQRSLIPQLRKEFAVVARELKHRGVEA